MPATFRLASVVFGLSLPLAAQRFVSIDQSPVSGHAHQSGLELLAGDLDRDGDPDFVEVSGSMLRNEDGHRFVASAPGTDVPFASPPGPLPTVPRIQLCTDVSGDGIPDLLAMRANFFGPSVLAVLRGRGDGSFTQDVAVGSTGAFASVLHGSDVTGDGQKDVFCRTLQGLELLRNLGGLSFANETATRLPPALVTTPLEFATTADVDGDGDLDLLTANSTTFASVWRNDGTGVFTADAANNLQAFGPTSDARFFDQDGDLDLDLLLFDQASGGLRLLANTGGVFAPSPVLFPAVAGTVGIAIGDVDRDGATDVVAMAGTRARADFVVFGNRGTSMPVVATSPALRPAIRPVPPLHLVDLDRDGVLDLGIDRDGFFLGDGSGGFRPLALPSAPRIADAVSALTEDVDGDGDLDLVSGGSVLLQDGDGRFTASSFALPGDGVARVLVDVDGDGDRDLVFTPASATTTNPLASGIAFDVGNGFATTSFVPGPMHGEVAAGDLDADGRPDLVFGDGRILRNVAGGTFAAGPVLPATAPGPVAVADFDGDGRRDVVLGLEHFRNLGSMTFATLGLLPLQQSAQGCEALVPADVDNDGDTDLVLRQIVSGSPSTGIYLQTPLGLRAGTFVSAFALQPSYELAVADVDGDGLVDLIDGSVWQNLGGGAFARLEDLPTGPDDLFAQAFAAADFDRDGDVDIAAARFTHVQVYANQKRQVRSPRVPTLGDPYEVEFAVEASWNTLPGAVLPLLALSRVPPVALPGLGLLHVDAGAAFRGPVLLTNPNGIAPLLFVVPDDPALDGVEFFWQALGQQGNQLRLSNVWRERIAR